MGTVKVNGVAYSGRNIRIENSTVYVDGKRVDAGDQKEVRIHVEGDIDSIQADVCEEINIYGKCGPVKTVSGDVKVKESVIGDIQTVSGDVDCGEVHGRINTVSGDVKHK
jgi:hypothetical protein